MRKKILIGIGMVLIIIQFLPNNIPKNSTYNPKDLFANNIISKDVESMIKISCYDCHSNQTIYPWYSYIAPASFVIGNHIIEGKEHLNFSKWESLSKLDKAEALDDLIEEIDEKEMPLKGYAFVHPKAKLSTEDRIKISAWAEKFAESIFE